MVCEKRDYQTNTDISEMEKFCKKVISIKRKKQWTLKNILKSTFSMDPFLVVGHTNLAMKNVLGELLEKEKFDLIHVETFYVLQNLPKTEIPVVLAEHNIEYLVYKRFADRAPIFLKLPFYLDVLKMKKMESFFWQKANRLIAVSEDEGKLMKRENVTVVPNGVDTKKFRVESGKLKDKNRIKKILFIGDFKWMQNRDSVEWILKEIWPKITLNSQFSTLNLKLWIVGKNIPSDIKSLAKDDSVIIDENNKQSTPEIFLQADLLLAPIRIGGGTSYKILEAMASGIPVITTKLGAEGLNVDNGKSVLVNDNPDEIAKMVIDVLGNEKLYKELSENARKVIENGYDWKIIARKLEKVYESAIKQG